MAMIYTSRRDEWYHTGFHMTKPFVHQFLTHANCFSMAVRKSHCCCDSNIGCVQIPYYFASVLIDAGMASTSVHTVRKATVVVRCCLATKSSNLRWWANDFTMKLCIMHNVSFQCSCCHRSPKLIPNECTVTTACVTNLDTVIMKIMWKTAVNVSDFS